MRRWPAVTRVSSVGRQVARMDGTGRRVVLQHELPHLFSISLLGDYVYWTDWTTRCIERAHKITGEAAGSCVCDRLVHHLIHTASSVVDSYTNDGYI